MRNPITKERFHLMDGFVILLASLWPLTPIGTWKGTVGLLIGYFVIDMVLASTRKQRRQKS